MECFRFNKDVSASQGTKTLESLAYLKNFIEKYERYKEHILYELPKYSCGSGEVKESPAAEDCPGESQRTSQISGPKLNVTRGKTKSRITSVQANSVTNRPLDQCRPVASKEEPFQLIEQKPNLSRLRAEDKSMKVKGGFTSAKLSSPSRGKGKLCKDSTKRDKNEKRVFTLCKNENIKVKLKNKNRKQKVQDTLSEVKKIIKPRMNLSETLVNLQDMHLEQMREEIKKLSDVSEKSELEKDKSSEWEGGVERSSTDDKSMVPIDCEKQDLVTFLKESKYTGSEMEILLGELLDFPGERKEAETGDQTDTGGGYEEEEMTGWGEEEETAGGEAQDTGERSSGVRTSDTSQKKTEDRPPWDEEEPETESRTRTSRARTFQFQAKLEGLLLQEMIRYYPVKVEGIQHQQEYINEEFLENYKEILGETLRQFGLPENETVLKELISKSDDRTETAEDYETIRQQQLRRVEKYDTRKTQNLKNIFDFKLDREKDVLKVIGPLLRQTLTAKKVGEEKARAAREGKRKGKKKDKKHMKASDKDGPFNIMKRNDVRRNVWRACLKRATRKMRYLKLAVEHRRKQGLDHEKFHGYFSEYFKKKRRELKRLREGRSKRVLVKCRHVELSEAASTSSYSSGDEYYPERGLMESLLPDHDPLQPEVPVPSRGGQQGKRRGKREKLNRERRVAAGQRLGLAPADESQLVTWGQQAAKRARKTRCRLVESYLYSSGDELLNTPHDIHKEEKRQILKQLAETLIPPEIPPIKLQENPQSQQDNTKQSKQEDKAGELKFYQVCAKFKLHYLHNLIAHDKFLKSPYDQQFMEAIGKMGDALTPFDNDSSFHLSYVKKIFKMAVRTCLGMFHIIQKENNLLKGSPIQDELDDNSAKRSVPLKWLMKQATVNLERQNKWLKRYLGIENSLKTEEKIHLYFGPPPETTIRIGPIKNKKSS